jgi:hypothetical protein
VTQEAEQEVLKFKARLVKVSRPFLKNKIQTKGLKVWLKWQSICLACARPWFNSAKIKSKKTDVI